ncbi:19494_t:CDS:2 [Rhizophagus irregularis]|nr:19494_t:CDS:2 [Rhizophagus irregularis]
MSKLLINLLISVLLSSAFVSTYAIYYPPSLYGQTSAYISSRLYIFGGTILNINNSVTFNHNIFYLDLSKPFNTTSVYPWSNELTTLDISHVNASACVGGAIQDNIFVFEGVPEVLQKSDGTIAPLIYKFDSQQKTVNPPQFNVTIDIPRRRSVQAVCDNQGKMYIFGGIDDFTSTGIFIYNRMDIFNTIELSYGWKVGNVTQSGGGRYGYSAVLLNNDEKIVYIGGRLLSGDYVRMNDIYIYNTNLNQWEYQNAGGTVPNVREGHSSVITPDNRIIVYGGSQADPQLAVLTLTEGNTFSWSTPNAKNPIPGLYLHSANLINSYYMFVTFDTSKPQEYSWITNFDPKNPPNVINSNGPAELNADDIAIQSKKVWVLGSIIGCVSGFVLSLAFIICLRQCDCCDPEI